jgi:hypothetical protein
MLEYHPTLLNCRGRNVTGIFLLQVAPYSRKPPTEACEPGYNPGIGHFESDFTVIARALCEK